MIKVSIVALFFVVVGAPDVLSQPLDHEAMLRQIDQIKFKGLGPIAVIVEDFGTAKSKAGISEEEIKSFVELQFRINGIPVADQGQYSLESPYAYISIDLMYLDRIDHFVFSTDLGLHQNVKILRSDEVVVGETWHRDGVGIAPSSDLRENIEKSINPMLTQFMNNYLAANPTR